VQELVERGIIVPVRFSKREIERLDRAVRRSGARSRSELIRDATERHLGDVGSMKVIQVRADVTVKDAKAEIVAYLRGHKEAETFDIANDLRLDLALTMRSLTELWEEGRVA